MALAVLTGRSRPLAQPARPWPGGRGIDGGRHLGPVLEVDLVAQALGERAHRCSPSYRARSKRRSTARWTRPRRGMNSANATRVDAATARVSPWVSPEQGLEPITAPTNTAATMPVTIAQPMVRLMRRSISYSRYRRTAIPMAMGRR